MVGFRFWSMAVYIVAAFSGIGLAPRETSQPADNFRAVQRTVLIAGVIWLGVFSAIAYLARDAGTHAAAWMSVLGGIASAPCFGLGAYFLALRRMRARSRAPEALGDRPAMRATRGQDGTGGYVLAHSRLSRAVIWIVLLASVGLFGIGIYAPLNGADVAVNVVTVPFAAGLGWLFLWLFRFTRSQVEVSDRGIAQRRGAFYAFVPWSEVASIREAPVPISVIFRSSDGVEVRVDKNPVGLPALLDLAERHLTPQQYFSALCYFRPLTALARRRQSPVPTRLAAEDDRTEDW